MGRVRPLAGVLACALVPLLASACGSEPPDPDLIPDATLQRELGLTDLDRVRTVTLVGGEEESSDPGTASIDAGTFVQFISGDWMVHEIAFEMDSLDGPARDFLTRTDQVASPPLLQRNARFVVSFDGAPPGRYPYRLEGNGRPGRGAIVVTSPDGTSPVGEQPR